MKILYTIAGLYRPAGMERILSLKANYLAKLGYDVTIVTTEQKGRPEAFPLEGSIRLVDLGIGYEDNNGKSFVDKLVHYPAKQHRHRKALAKLLQELRPDVTVSLFDGDERFLYKIKDGSKKVLELHFSRYKRLQYNRGGIWALADRLRSYQDERTVSKYDRFVVLTEEDLKNWGSPANACVIPNFLNGMPDEPATLGRKTVLAVGRYDYQKGFDRLISAWAMLPANHRWKLRLVGEGPLRDALAQQVKDLGVQDSVFIDKTHRNMDAVYHDASIYALSSHYEGLPMVLLEAQSHGLPIVAFDCKCGPSDVVTDEVDGLLVPEGDVPALAKALERIMDNPRLRKEMGARALLSAARWDKESIMQQWILLFASI